MHAMLLLLNYYYKKNFVLCLCIIKLKYKLDEAKYSETLKVNMKFFVE